MSLTDRAPDRQFTSDSKKSMVTAYLDSWIQLELPFTSDIPSSMHRMQFVQS